MAEVCAKISSPPNSTMIMTIGMSQNFFRVRMNAQSSNRIDIRIDYASFPAPGQEGAG